MFSKNCVCAGEYNGDHIPVYMINNQSTKFYIKVL